MTPALRPAGPADESFLLRVYAGTREEELAQLAWAREQKDAFIRMQFAAREHHYRQHYADATFDVVTVNGVPVGLLYVARWAAEIRIVDVAIVAEHRGRGVGTALLENLIAEAGAAGKPLTIHVERFNPALRLYERLGFSVIADEGVYLLLARAPAGAQAKTAS
ncbi:MAG: GNAT family N-acetyltransferase [Acidimicrobiales bacterium]